ncbi:MAG: O-methyltransferase, partial [Leptotrichiaceae bacterium]
TLESEDIPKRYKTIVTRLKVFIEELNENKNFVLLPFGDGIGIIKNKI